jgi:hypothetical protein
MYILGGEVYEDEEIIDRNVYDEEEDDEEDDEDDYYVDNDDLLSIIFMDKMNINHAILA